MKNELNYTITQIAKIMGMTTGSVECFMLSGILKSFEASPGEYRVKQSDLEVFRERMNQH